MNLRGVVSVSALALTTGVALWITDASLDLFDTTSGTVRVAMLPSLERLALLGAGALAIACVLVQLVGPGWRDRRAAGSWLERAAGLLAPLGALGVLLLPYLPWVPDRLPVLRVLAGPARILLWLVILLQLGWLLIPGAIARWTGRPDRRSSADTSGTRTPLGPVLVVGLIGFVLFTGVALLRTGTPVFPGGDEPHYLVIAQSLWRDGDLKIENNHQRRDYAEYFGNTLAPHYLTRGVDQEIYSVHPVGLPVITAPVYGVAGYRGVVIFLTLIGAAAGAAMWWWAFHTTGSRSAATFAWIVICLSVPYLFNTFSVYPEIVAALAVVLAIAPSPWPSADRQPWIWAARGIAVAVLPWLSTKYAPMAGALALVLAGRIWRNPDVGPKTLPGASLMIPLLVSLGGWFLFFYLFWGSPLPSAPYGGYHQTQLSHLLVGAPGLLLDQEYGVVSYAPGVILAFTGLASMWRRGGPSRVLALEIAAVTVALLGTVGAFRIWWGGSAVPGRPLVSGLLLLGIPIAWQHGRADRAPLRLAAHRLLATAGVAISCSVAIVGDGLLVVNGRDGSSRFLEWISPDWHLWAVFPSFIYDVPSIALGFSAAWLVAAGAYAWWLGQYRCSDEARGPGQRRAWHGSDGGAVLTVTLSAVLMIVLVSAVVLTVFRARLQPDVRLDGRSRITMLDTFDAGRRPLAFSYDTFRRVSSEQVPTLFKLTAAPDIARPRQSVPLLFNARFALPAGRYRLESRWPDLAPERPSIQGELALQVTRSGPPVETWDVPIAGGQSWSTSFTLPLDASFVGLTGSPELERSRPEITLRPLDIVDARLRERIPAFVAAATYGSTTAYFHDLHAWAERSGFWVEGEAASQVTLAFPGERSITLSIHCGPEPNVLRLDTPAGSERLELTPGTSRRVPLAGTPTGLVRIRFSATSGFVPSEHDPTNADSRRLGCWVQPQTGE